MLTASSSKQPAQERLKRLQANLKYSHNKKQDKERHSPQKKTRRSSSNNSSNTSSSHASTASHQQQQQNHFQLTPPRQPRNFPESPKYYRSPEKTKTAQYLETVSASTTSSSSRHRSSSSRTAQYFEPVSALPNSSFSRLRSHSGAHHKQPSAGSSSSNFAELKNAWAKPKALLDASNRLEAGSRSVSGK